LIEWGKKCLIMEHEFNLKAGIGPEQDCFPKFLTEERLEDVDRHWSVKTEEIKNFWKDF
jgi:aldehyde:ferredoxin oxidoreductase